MPVISKESAPALTFISVRISLRQISSDRGEPNEDPELFEFCLNLASTPAVLIRESANEHSNLRGNRRPARSGLRDLAPVELLGSFASSPYRCHRATVSGWTMTHISFHPDQVRDSTTQKPRSTGVIRGRRPFSETVASCWRRASSTIACLLRLRKKAGIQRRTIGASLGSCCTARTRLKKLEPECETESFLPTGLPLAVDRSSIGSGHLNVFRADRF